MIGETGGNPKKHSITGRRMGKLSSSTLVTMLGLIIATVVVLSCVNDRKHSARSLDSLTPSPIYLKSNFTSSRMNPALINVKANESIKKKENLRIEKKKVFIEEISDENMEIIRKDEEKEVRKSNFRKEIQKDITRKEDRKWSETYPSACL